MDKNETLQNKRLALEEANRWLRFLENFFWIISSFWMVGTGIAFFKAFEWNGQKGQVIIICFIMILASILFSSFNKNIIKGSKKIKDRVKYYENELEIDILHKNQIKSGVQFKTIMNIFAFLSIVIWCGLGVQYIVKDWQYIVEKWCNLYHYCYCLFH